MRRVSSQGFFRCIGTKNGSVRLEVLKGDLQGKIWEFSIHDGDSGCVSAVTSSFDDKIVLTGSLEGGLFIYHTEVFSPNQYPIAV